MAFPKNWEELETEMIARKGYVEQYKDIKPRQEYLNMIIALNGYHWAKRKVFEMKGFEHFDKFKNERQKRIELQNLMDRVATEQRLKRFNKARSTKWGNSPKKKSKKSMTKKKENEK